MSSMQARACCCQCSVPLGLCYCGAGAADDLRDGVLRRHVPSPTLWGFQPNQAGEAPVSVPRYSAGRPMCSLCGDNSTSIRTHLAEAVRAARRAGTESRGCRCMFHLESWLSPRCSVSTVFSLHMTAACGKMLRVLALRMRSADVLLAIILFPQSDYSLMWNDLLRDRL